MSGLISGTNIPPDAEIIARAWALSKTSITDIVSQRVATRLPANPTLPFLVLEKTGGSLIDEDSQIAINGDDIVFNCYAGRYGGDNTKGEPDYTTASNLANAIYKEAHVQGNTVVTTSGGTKARIYGFRVTGTPVRVEEPELLIANFQIFVSMIYRASA